MHLRARRLVCVFWSFCAAAAACGGGPGSGDSDTNAELTTSTASGATIATGDGPTSSGTGAGTTGSVDSTGTTSTGGTTSAGSETTGSSETTAGETTAGETTAGETTTGETTTGETTGETTAGESTTSDSGTTGVDTTTGDDSSSTGAADPWGCEEGEPITVNGDGKYGSLKAAVAAAPPNATITVCPGIYEEAVTIDRPMTLIGAGQGKTVLDGGDATTPILVKAVSVTIEGFTVQHGKAVHDVLGNGVCGGALAIQHTNNPMTVTVKDCTFTDNHGQYGGAICYDGQANDDSVQKLVLEGVTITGNSAEVNGGGLFSYSATTMTDTMIVGNTAGNHGGGIYFSYSDNVIVGGAVKQNTAGDGGGMFIQSPVWVDVEASDWGFGQADENVPNDVEHAIHEYGFFGADVSFYCEYITWDAGMCALK